MKNITKTTQTILFAGLITAMILPFSAMDFADADKGNDKSSAKDKVKDKMKEQVKKDKDVKVKHNKKKYTSDEYGIPYNMLFEANGKLVVGISAEKAVEFDKRYSKTDVQNDLGTLLDLDVRYFAFEREAIIKGGDGAVKNNDPDSLATITVVKNNKIVTTGHAYSLNDIVAVGQSGGGTACNEVKITKDNNSSGDYADAAYGIDTYNSQCDNYYQNDSIRYNGNSYSVTYGTASDITLYKSIKMAGMTTTSSGYILDTDVTVKFGNDVLNDQVVGSYSSAGGDSGAPVFEIINSSSAKLLGQHVGKSCEVDLHSGTNYGQWCSNTTTGAGALVIFSPWDQVASHLGI